jgi:lipopolysaccharide export LptBFGC system permease protein LptF
MIHHWHMLMTVFPEIEFATFFAMMFVNYLLICLNMRYVAKGSYTGVAWSDGLILVLGFTVIQQVAEAHTWAARLGYIGGGIVGAQLGLWLTRHHGNASEDCCSTDEA